MQEEPRQMSEGEKFPAKVEEGSYSYEKAKKFILFMAMGAGANWVFPTALAQEIPYLENELPEKLCIATYMNSSTNFGVISVMIYLYISNYVCPIPFKYSVPALLSTSVFGCFFAAIFYRVSYGGVSFMLYIACAIGGTVGALSQVIMNPFMSQFQNIYISAGRSGGSSTILLSAVFAAIQGPGGAMRFTVATYMCIFGIILLCPLASYRYITLNNIGKREIESSGAPGEDIENPINEDRIKKSSSRAQQNEESNQESSEIAMPAENRNAENSNDNSNDNSNGRNSSDVEAYTDDNSKDNRFSTNTEITVNAFPCDPKYEDACKYDIINSKLDRIMYNISLALVSDSMNAKEPWLRRTIPFMMCVAWVDFNTWGMMTALAPFALANVSKGTGSVSLAIAYEVGAFTLAMGDISTSLFKLPLFQALLVFTSFTFTVFLAAVNLKGYDTDAAAPILVILFCIVRFIESHVVTSCYRCVSTRFNPEMRVSATRAIGITDQITTTLGSIVSTVIVSTIINCKNSDDD